MYNRIKKLIFIFNFIFLSSSLKVCFNFGRSKTVTRFRRKINNELIHVVYDKFSENNAEYRAKNQFLKLMKKEEKSKTLLQLRPTSDTTNFTDSIQLKSNEKKRVSISSDNHFVPFALHETKALNQTVKNSRTSKTFSVHLVMN